MSFIVFAVVLIVIIVINTNSLIEQSYTNQDLRYDLNYSLYSGALIDKDGGPNRCIDFISNSGNLGLNLLIIKDQQVVYKAPESFFLKNDSIYTTFSEKRLHPYSSFTDFSLLTKLLEYENINLPEGVLALSSGSWVGSTGEEHAADFIQTSKGYLIYIISDEPFDDEVGLFGSLGRGFLVGVFAIIIFVTLTYYYIKIRLKPIQLMQDRVRALQEGDLESKIEIMGTDELAELSIIFNKLILDIKNLINQKHRVLLDVSHELKTPLTRMRLLLEIMPDNKQKEELKIEIEFLNEVISNLLLTDKLDMPYSSLDIVEGDLCEFITKTLATLSPENLSLITVTPPIKSCIVSIDQTKIMIAVRNIIQNAFKYGSPEKGIHINISVNKNIVYIKIRDFGVGIKKEDVENIFTPFFRSTNNRVSGIGLGLAITKKIMKSHGGDVIFNEQIKEGTEFVLKFPSKQ